MYHGIVNHTRSAERYAEGKFIDLVRGLGTHYIEKAQIIGHSVGGGTSIFFVLNYIEHIKKMICVDFAGIPTRLPLHGKIINLPYVEEFMYGLQNNFIRLMTLKKNWIYNKKFLTDNYFENVTCFH